MHTFNTFVYISAMKFEDEIKQKEFKSEHQKMMLNIIFTSNWLNCNLIKAFKPYGVSPQQYNVLRILKGQYPKAITVNQITERMLDKNSNTSRLVDKLVYKNLVKREVCQQDRRQMDIVITKKGLNLIDKMKKEIVLIESSLVDSVSESDAKKINCLLDNIRD